MPFLKFQFWRIITPPYSGASFYTAVNTKLKVDDILGEYGAAVVDKRDPKVTFIGWGGETSHAMFRPLHYGSTVNIGYKDKIDMADLNIDQEVKNAINQCVAELSVDNHVKA